MTELKLRTMKLFLQIQFCSVKVQILITVLLQENLHPFTLKKVTRYSVILG